MTWSDAAREAALLARQHNVKRDTTPGSADQNQNVLYHGTNAKNLRSIMSEGIKPNAKLANPVSAKQVSLSKEVGNASHFAGRNDHGVVLKVEGVETKEGRGWMGHQIHQGPVPPANIKAVAVVSPSGKLGAWHALKGGK